MKIFRLVFGLALTAALVVAGATAQADIRDMRLNVKSAILVDVNDGRILFEQNADQQIAPASITKILTMYILNEYLREGRVEPWDKVLVSKEAAMVGGARMRINAGERVPLEDLMKGMAVASGNNACVAVAEYIAGDVNGFVALMNRKARELGMTHSTFKNPNGLPAEGQYVTARDMIKLSRSYLENFPESLEVHSMQTYTYNNRTNHNANRLLGRYEGADGLKTGFVNESRYNIVATAKRGGVRLLAVVLGANTPGIRTMETARLLEEGFRTVNPALCEVGPLLKPLPAEVASGADASSVKVSKVAKTLKTSKTSKLAKAEKGVGTKKVVKAEKKGSSKVVKTAVRKDNAGKKASKSKNSKYTSIRTSKS